MLSQWPASHAHAALGLRLQWMIVLKRQNNFRRCLEVGNKASHISLQMDGGLMPSGFDHTGLKEFDDGF
jgi:hypothetical protein